MRAEGNLISLDEPLRPLCDGSLPLVVVARFSGRRSGVGAAACNGSSLNLTRERRPVVALPRGSLVMFGFGMALTFKNPAALEPAVARSR